MRILSEIQNWLCWKNLSFLKKQKSVAKICGYILGPMGYVANCHGERRVELAVTTYEYILEADGTSTYYGILRPGYVGCNEMLKNSII
jgi:hypothetical protein